MNIPAERGEVLAMPSSAQATPNPVGRAPPQILAMAPSSSAKTANGDIAGGLAAAGVNFALAVSLGLLAFMPLGPKYYEVGIYAGFASAIYGQLVAGLFGGAAHPGGGRRAATALILAALVAALG